MAALVYIVQGPRVGAIPISVVNDRDASEIVIVNGPRKGGQPVYIVDASVGGTIRVRIVADARDLSSSLAGMGYTNKVNSYFPIAYWPQAESSGNFSADETGNGRDGRYTSVTLGVTGIGDGRTAASYDGSSSFDNVYSTSLNGAFNGKEGTALAWMKVSALADWSDGTAREILQIQADANNRIRIRKSTVANTLNFWYNAGGTFTSIDIAGLSSVGWIQLVMTWSKSADRFIVYINGGQVGNPQGSLGTYVGSLLSNACCLGASTTAPAEVFKGSLAHIALWNTALTYDVIAALAIIPSPS